MQINWKIDGDQKQVHFTVQRDIVLTPTTFTLSFDSVELLYAQLLGVRIKVREDAKQRVRIT